MYEYKFKMISLSYMVAYLFTAFNPKSFATDCTPLRVSFQNAKLRKLSHLYRREVGRTTSFAIIGRAGLQECNKRVHLQVLPFIKDLDFKPPILSLPNFLTQNF